LQLGLKCNYACQYCSQAHQPHDLDGHPSDVEPFMDQLQGWFAGGTDGRGSGVKIEFWGGEPFVYWKLLKPLGEAVRDRYPAAELSIVTNGSLLDDEKLAWVEDLDIGIGLSHDGPAQAHRGPDPLGDPATLKNIKRWVSRRMPINRMSFNTVLHRHNDSLKAVRKFFADRLDLPAQAIVLATEEIMLPYDTAGLALSLTGYDHARYRHRLFWELATGSAMAVGTLRDKVDEFLRAQAESTLRDKVDEFLRTQAESRPLASLGQKCGMDRDDSIAVDMKGNVTTCQNMSALTHHKVGHVEQFDEIRLDTAYHFSTRSECPRCPVVQLCKGACLFLEGQFWTAACDNALTHNLAVLAAAIYYQTQGLILTRITADGIRREGITSLEVIDLGFVESNGDMATVAPSPRVSKPFPVQVVAA
ncbi:MAG: SPASM domain-containing protein, partial [Betaproteobacteria bacterium]|nr:SPASM domain-containing protein [Betaproteobacteria bacterium]